MATSKTPKRRAILFRPATYDLIVRLLQHIGPHRRRQMLLLFGLMLLSALAEMVSLGTVLPFLGVLIAPEKVLNYPAVAGVLDVLNIDLGTADVVWIFTVAFAIAALFAGAVRILLTWSTSRVAYAIGADLSIEVYRRTLYQPYRVHVARNSSAVISGITSKVATATNVLLSLLGLGSSFVMLVAIMAALLAIDALVATVAVACFGTSYGLITWLSRRRLVSNSRRIAHESIQVVKALQEGLGGIRDVLLDGTQAVYTDIYRRADEPLRRALGNNFFISQGPRYAIEALGMILIATLAYSMSRQPGGIGVALPVLGALALGAQRLLPALQQFYMYWSNLTADHASLIDALELLDQPLPDDFFQPVPAPLIFQDAIALESVRFRYGTDGPWVLDGLNLSIPKGARVGIVGSTGSGKSTALDLLMLLLEPTHGRILADGQPISGDRRRAWQRTLAHVPQSIYLADTTLAENIAFGVPPEHIDLDRVRQAARQAQIAEFIESRPEGYQAFVGERGIRLSGGQRQRIGIARALYKQATVLVFDEATSALDNATEQAVMESIESLNRDLTLLIIAHRLSTVQRCDTIVELDRGRVAAQGTYEYLLTYSPTFRKMALAK